MLPDAGMLFECFADNTPPKNCEKPKHLFNIKIISLCVTENNSILIPGMRTKLLCPLFIILLFSSCQKEIHFPSTNPPATSNITLQYNPLNATSTKFELIITDSGNKVLYDNELEVKKPHSINIAAKEYNLTTIEYDDAEKKYKSKTYLNIKATNWVIRPMDDKQDIGSSNISTGSDAKLMYENVPPFTGFTFYSGSQYQPGSTVSVTPITTQKKIEVSYKRLDNKYISYLMIPSLGLYKIHQTTSSNDIVDASQMDAVVNKTFSKPTNLVYSYIDLYGFLNTTNYNNGIQLYHTDPQIFGTQYDVIYPTKGISEFFFFGLFGDDAGGQFLYSSLANAVPQDLQFIDNSFFKIVANQNDKFQIAFLKEGPSFYSITNNSANLSHVIFASPEETTIDPSLIVAILSNSKFLKGQNFSDYKIGLFSFYKADSYNYLQYFENLYSPSSGNKIKLSRNYLLPLQ